MVRFYDEEYPNGKMIALGELNYPKPEVGRYLVYNYTRWKGHYPTLGEFDIIEDKQKELVVDKEWKEILKEEQLKGLKQLIKRDLKVKSL